MNFLAHLALAGPTDASLVGNLLGDFTRGTREHLLKEYPEPLVDGMFMHRSIDRFTDAHPCFKEARDLMQPQHKRFAGVVVDIFFDHYLSLHWHSFHSAPIDDFIEHCYQTLENNPQWHSERFAMIFPYMRDQNWLACYRTKEGIETTLKRVSQRGKFTAPIAGCHADFESNYEAFEDIFLRFYPDLLEHAQQLLRTYSSSK